MVEKDIGVCVTKQMLRPNMEFQLLNVVIHIYLL